MARKRKRVSKPDSQKLVAVPYGNGSLLDMLECGEAIASETMIGLTLHCRSHFDSGFTRYVKHSELADWFGFSPSFVARTLKGLSGDRVELVNKTEKGCRYNIVSHLPFNGELPEFGSDGKPLRFYIPRIVFTKFFNKEISWKACLVWIGLKRYSEWGGTEDGVTRAANIPEIAKRVRLHNRDVIASLKELAGAGLIQRLTPKNQKGIYQLYTIPKSSESEAKQPAQTEFDTQTSGDDGYMTPQHWYSRNRQWRCVQERTVPTNGTEVVGGKKRQILILCSVCRKRFSPILISACVRLANLKKCSQDGVGIRNAQPKKVVV